MIPDEKAFEMKTISEMVEGIDKLLELKQAEEAGDTPEEEKKTDTGSEEGN